MQKRICLSVLFKRYNKACKMGVNFAGCVHFGAHKISRLFRGLTGSFGDRL